MERRKPQRLESVASRNMIQKALPTHGDAFEERCIDDLGECPAEQPVAYQRLAQVAAEKERAENALQVSELKYRILTELEFDSIFLIDDETGSFLEVNSACESLYGYSRQELLKMKDSELSTEPLSPCSVIPSSKDVHLPIRYHKKKDGTIFPVEIKSRKFIWQEREVRIAVTRNISSRIEADKAYAKLDAQLIQFQKMETIGTLSGGIAHDFNNILSAIMGYAELAIMHMDESGPSRGHLQEVLRASQRAKALVGQILAFSRENEPEFGPVQIGLIVKETIKMLRATLPASIQIDSDVTTDGMVMADAGQIQQVVMNLCTNAYHAMKESGGQLRIKLTELFLDSAAARPHDLKPGPYLRLLVADTGIGINRNLQHRIFEPYFTTKKKGEGSGLGLSMTYGIIKNHKGGITLKSKPAKGSSFFVYLPKLEYQPTDRKQVDDAVILLGDEHILCVDDEPVLAELLKTALTDYGYHVTTRSSALEALELFKQKPASFDLVITDLNMPHLSGDVLAKKIIKIRHDIPIILCTGFSDRVIERDLTAAGIRAVALKPLLRTDLAKLIRQVLTCNRPEFNSQR